MKVGGYVNILKPFHSPETMVGLVGEENEQRYDEIPVWDGEPSRIPIFGAHLNDIQKQLASESQPLTVFITPFGLYQFNVWCSGNISVPNR